MLQLIFAPWRLAIAAERTTIQGAMIAAVVVVSCLLGARAAGVGTAGCEPFPDLQSYFVDAAVLSLVFALVIYALPTVACVLAIRFLVRALRFNVITRQLVLRMIFLSVLPLTLPVLAWSVLAALSEAQSPSCEFYAWTRPVWLSSSIIRILAARWWGAVLIGLALVNLGVAFSQVPRIAERLAAPSCDTCGYNLTGNVTGVCPECGAAR